MLWFHKLLAKIGIRTERYLEWRFSELTKICEKILKNSSYGSFGTVEKVYPTRISDGLPLPYWRGREEIRPKQIIEASMDEVKRGEEN